MIKLSVITPVFNSIRFIEFCIRNVIGQNCPDVEHIIVDGGSSDGTVETVKRYADQYPHIRWISEKDEGQSDAMNKGIAMARGGIIGFLNVDDYYEPDVLGRVLKIFSTLPEPSLVVGNCNVLDDSGAVIYLNRPQKLGLFYLISGFDIHQWPVNPAAYFYHKSLHEKVGLYDVNEHYGLDLDFLLRAVQEANVAYVDETWGNWRNLRGNKTFQLCERGENIDVCHTIFRKYEKDLPAKKRMVLLLYRCIMRTFNMIRNPMDLAFRVKKFMNLCFL